MDAIREWFRTYKIPDGKPENKFGLKGKCMDAAYAMKVIDETHHAWYVNYSFLTITVFFHV